MTCPSTLDDFIGQPALCERLKTMVEAALLGNRPLPHLLLAGPPGIGKTSLAHALAGSVGDPLYVLTDPGRFELALANPGIVLLDLSTAPRALVTKVTLLLKFGRAAGADDAGVTLIATTTEAARIGVDLHARFLAPRWEPYSPAELAVIVSRIAGCGGIVLDGAITAGLARAAHGTPRHAAALVAAAGQLVDAGAPVTLPDILELAGFSADGLCDAHFAYLRTLRDCAGGAPPGLLATALCLHASVLAEVETALLADGLIIYNSRVRELTNLGARRLEDHEKEKAA